MGSRREKGRKGGERDITSDPTVTWVLFLVFPPLHLAGWLVGWTARSGRKSSARKPTHRAPLQTPFYGIRRCLHLPASQFGLTTFLPASLSVCLPACYLPTAVTTTNTTTTISRCCYAHHYYQRCYYHISNSQPPLLLLPALLRLQPTNTFYEWNPRANHVTTSRHWPYVYNANDWVYFMI